MTPKTKLFEWIEDYCMSNLEGAEKLEFETELKRNSELKAEVKFEKELQDAINEKDVLNLKEKLEKAATQKAGTNGNGSFEMLEGFANIEQLTSTVPPEELLEFYDSLPKVHVYQHELVSNENIHEFYREQNLPELEEDFSIDDFDDFDLDGLEEAINEKDVMDLRSTLSQVSRSVNLSGSTEEIDNYINGELTGKELEQFENELAMNNRLEREVEIHRELEKAVSELDIINLKEKLVHLMETETSWNVSEQHIEDFIDGVLEGKELEEFNAELNENTGLKAEVNLRKNVDKSVGEKDIINLRDKLREVKKEAESKEIKSIVPDSKVHNMHWLKTGVAVAVILFALAGLFRNEFSSVDSTYNNYFESPQWSPQRSVATDAGFLQEANILFSNGEYEKAISLYDQAIQEKDEKYVFQFYKAASLQNLGKFEQAIPEYTQVIEHGDNMFVEEAEWYKSLCYLKMHSKAKAKDQLTAIVNRNSYYAKDAKAVLRKLRYSFK